MFVMIAGFAGISTSGISLEVTTETFSDILKENNSTVVGENVVLTDTQLQGFLSDIEDASIVQKYSDYLNKSTQTSLLAEEIVELHYYSLSESEQADFRKKTQNQRIDVSADDHGTILISYNPNY